MTREEAIERIKARFDKWALDNEDMKAIQTLIPELGESEERIRKELVAFFKGMQDSDYHEKYWHDLEIDRILAYLEKQKEHQFCSDAPKEKSVGGDFYSSHKDKNLDEIAQEYVAGVKQYNPEPTWDLMQTAVCYGANWQKEQFEKNRLANCDALSKEECDRETDFAMEIIEKEHRQPTFNDAINYGMRLQKEQKPEWSKDDKRKLNRIYEILGQAADEKPFGSSKRIIGDKEAVELQDFIKLLRPSWKPSEEQMDRLFSIVAAIISVHKIRHTK